MSLYLLSAVMVLFAGLIGWKQRRAASCPLHNRRAGRVATGLAALLLAGAIGLTLFTLSL